jgi:hypothetical protein
MLASWVLEIGVDYLEGASESHFQSADDAGEAIHDVRTVGPIEKGCRLIQPKIGFDSIYSSVFSKALMHS